MNRVARTRITCRGCRRKVSDPDVLSHAGYCGDCGPARMAANVRALQAGTGPEYDRWLRATAAGLARAAARVGAQRTA